MSRVRVPQVPHPCGFGFKHDDSAIKISKLLIIFSGLGSFQWEILMLS